MYRPIRALTLSDDTHLCGTTPRAASHVWALGVVVSSVVTLCREMFFQARRGLQKRKDAGDSEAKVLHRRNPRISVDDDDAVQSLVWVFPVFSIEVIFFPQPMDQKRPTDASDSLQKPGKLR